MCEFCETLLMMDRKCGDHNEEAQGDGEKLSIVCGVQLVIREQFNDGKIGQAAMGFGERPLRYCPECGRKVVSKEAG